MGEHFERQNVQDDVTDPSVLNQDEEEAQRMVKEDLFPHHLNWTINLKKLVLIKYGMFSSMTNTRFGVQSLLLNDLCFFIFTEAGPPLSLHCLWIQGFHPNYTPFFSSLMETPQIKSYFLSGVGLCYSDYYMRAEDEYSIVENVGGLRKFPRNHQQTILPKLKHARILDCDPDENQVS